MYITYLHQLALYDPAIVRAGLLCRRQRAFYAKLDITGKRERDLDCVTHFCRASA